MDDFSNPHTSANRRPPRELFCALAQEKLRRQGEDARLAGRMAGAILLLAEAGTDPITEADLIQRYGFTQAEIDRVGTKARAIAARANPALAKPTPAENL